MAQAAFDQQRALADLDVILAIPTLRITYFYVKAGKSTVVTPETNFRTSISSISKFTGDIFNATWIGEGNFLYDKSMFFYAQYNMMYYPGAPDSHDLIIYISSNVKSLGSYI